MPAVDTVRTPTRPSVYEHFIDAERDDYEDDTELLRKSFDVRVWYRGGLVAEELDSPGQGRGDGN